MLVCQWQVYRGAGADPDGGAVNAAARTPVLVHGGMSAGEMASACGFRLRRITAWRYSVVTGGNEVLFTGTMPGIKAFLRREGYVS